MSHICPRRQEAPYVIPGDSGEDEYRAGHGLVGQPSGCSYCGSMSGDDFMVAVQAGQELGPTDKSYKVYLDNHGGKFYFQHLSLAQRHEFIDLINAGSVHIGYPGYFYVLPYFITRAEGPPLS